MHQRGFEPGLEQRRDERPTPLTSEARGEFGVLLDGNDPTTPPCKSDGDEATAGARIGDQVVRTNGGGVEQTMHERVAGEEISRNAELVIWGGPLGDAGLS
jgi:hypothetical protein